MSLLYYFNRVLFPLLLLHRFKRKKINKIKAYLLIIKVVLSENVILTRHLFMRILESDFKKIFYGYLLFTSRYYVFFFTSRKLRPIYCEMTFIHDTRLEMFELWKNLELIKVLNNTITVPAQI